jgi:hypothetical protein
MRNGVMYFSRDNGEIYLVDPLTCEGIYIGDTDVDKLHDLSSYIGEVELYYARITLTIPAGSISQDAEVTLTMNTNEILGGVAVTFEPHGTTFSLSVELDIYALGVDLNNVDTQALDVFYDNAEENTWDPMEKDELIIDKINGKVQVKKAKLPHFSRYAIGEMP